MGVTDPYGHSDDASADIRPVSGVSMVSTFLNWVGAITSVALVAGLALWGYKLTVRDVSGVPVVRALEGPMRVQPEDPGGSQAAHQGLAVNAVQAEGTAAAPADKIVLAPQPLQLTEADVLPKPDLDQPVPAAKVEATINGVAIADEPKDSAASDAADHDPVLAALQEAQRTVTEANKTPKNEQTLVSASTPGVKSSPRPRLRPASDIVRKAAETAVSLSAEQDIDVDAATLATGTRLVQLGAYDSEKIAKTEWDRLAARFGPYMAEKKRVIQKAQSAGRSFYRLRAMGFDDINDARRFCSALLAENAACIPVVIR